MEVPTGCRERYEWILKRGSELGAQFTLGNRTFVLEELASHEPKVAMALVACMMEGRYPEEQGNLRRFLMESA